MNSRPLLLGGLDVALLLHAYRTNPSPFQACTQSGPTPTLLVSACLLGCRVTYRGGCCAPRSDDRTPLGFLLDYLSRRLGLLRCIPICPEMDLLGMSSPRPPMRLVWNRHTAQMFGTTKPNEEIPLAPGEWKERDVAERLRRRHPLLAEEMLQRRLRGLDGCLLKSRSPSCGVGDARVYETRMGGKFAPADGFFVREWVRATGESIPIVSERQLCFGVETETTSGGVKRGRKGTKSVCSFLEDVMERFERRNALIRE